MSASEILCMVRYFCLMVGDLVPYESLHWKLYLLLHRIVELMLC